MTHVPKNLWATAFLEGKRVAEHVLELNRKLKQFVTRKPEDPPTDRELALAACVNIFWAFKLEQEAAAAARSIAIRKAKHWIQAGEAYEESMEARRIVKGLNKLLARTEGDGFLALWGRMEQFLAVAQKPEYWKQFDEDPSTIICALADDLQRVAQQGEDNGTQTEGRDDEHATGERAPGTEGGADQADRAAKDGADGTSLPHEPGEDRAPEAIRGGGEGLEGAARGVQEPHQEPSGPGGQDPGRGEGGNGGEH